MLIDLSFDDAATAANIPSTSQVKFETQFTKPDFVPGIRGLAWRSDGFSSWLSTSLKLSPNAGFTIEGWVALESLPSDIEAPVNSLRPAALMQQATTDTGFDIFVDSYGRWGFRVSTAAGNRQVNAPEPFPVGTWAHIAATFDPAAGAAILYLDGREVGRVATGAGKALRPASVSFQVARSWRDATLGIFRVNGVNGAFDDVRVSVGARSPDTIRIDASAATPPVTRSLVVPATRFADDLQRPVFHAMPSANWTNEPHGLIRRGGEWHMFYQRTPNGPYKTEMHWGHMASRDLVDWTYLPDALWPTLQTPEFGFDMKGIWSGDVVTGPRGVAYAFYTSVNHSPIYNPGISVAISADRDLRTWRKRGPVIDAKGLRDFRDPYVWQEDNEWRMFVGAAMPGKGGGIAYYRCADIDDIKCWKKQPRIAPFDKMDVGSDIWEMPVFEALGQGKHILVANPIGGAVTKYGDPTTRAVYWIGRWDGKTFQPDDLRPHMLDVLPGHLSPTVDRDAQGNLVGIGIVDERRSTEAQKRAGWAHTFGLPRIWRLLPDGKTLGQSPLPALETLRNPAQAISQTLNGGGADRPAGDLGRSTEIIVDVGSGEQIAPYGVFLAASADGREITRLVYDPAKMTLTLDKSRSTLGTDDEGPKIITGAYDATAFGPPRKFHVFVDHSVVDIFINDAAAASFRIYPTQKDSTRFGVIGGAGPATVQAWALRPAKFTADLAPDG
ncbi:GH32 C-terminal domain-containing protein [Sphingomonas aliaeris]|uniref:beta-fructofuranosidase n=1 Tax=Sphingomonas aliaeris TaxID=2759526 RepID=A0A974NVG5_9SPHN|nr:LamG-like jellyroll fold domain-containing protein [Sphingomonas aliaeris]QQV77642.1 GH32 C-terminal domain-containing protein [Sphingomonas aliaeris]